MDFTISIITVTQGDQLVA